MVTAIVGRAAFLPFPGVENPAVGFGVKNTCTITELPTISPTALGDTTISPFPDCKWRNESDPLSLYDDQNQRRFVNLKCFI